MYVSFEPRGELVYPIHEGTFLFVCFSHLKMHIYSSKKVDIFDVGLLVYGLSNLSEL